MASFQMVWSVSVTSYDLWFTSVNMKLRPWTNWADIHSDFGRIDRYLIMAAPPFIQTTYYIGWWAIPISTWLFVAFFAFGHDAVEEYKRCFVWIRDRVIRVMLCLSKKDELSRLSTVNTKDVCSSSDKALPPTPTSVYKDADSSADDTTTDIPCHHNSTRLTSFLPYHIYDPGRQHNLANEAIAPIPTSIISPTFILTPLPPPRHPRAHVKSVAESI